MSTIFVPKYIVDLFKNEIINIHEELLKNIAKDYNIPYEELNEKYIPTVNITTEHEQTLEIIKRRSYNKNLKDCDRCTSLNNRGYRCKRSKLKNEDVCAIHAHHNNKTSHTKNANKLY